MKKKKPLFSAPARPFDKYFYYLHSVQDPHGNMTLLRQMYLELRGHVPERLMLREDFCGTFANACAWVALSPGFRAHALDRDPEPLAYGRENYLPILTPEQRERLTVEQGDVLEARLATADVVAALNFAACFFHTRKSLIQYAARVRESLAPGGIAVFDLLGGSFYEEDNEHETEIDEPEEFNYYFEQRDFDPLTRTAEFRIHFKRWGEPTRKNVWAYKLRLWTPPELKDALLDAGFSDVRFYWEGSDDEGEGNDEFTLAERGDSCESFHAYIVALR